MTRLLVVDDDPVVRQELAALLREDGHEVTTASGGFEALEALERAPFDVMFTDLRMPKMNGLDLLKEVRTRFPEVAPVMITGNSSAETAVEALRVGAVDYIPKPFRMDQLTTVLEQVEREQSFRKRCAELSSNPEEVAQRMADAGGQLLVFVWDDRKYVAGHTLSLEGGHAVDRSGGRSDLAHVESVIRLNLDRVEVPNVLIERVDRLLDGSDDEAVATFLEEISELCRARGGRMVVTVRQDQLRDAQVGRLRRALRENFTPEVTRNLASSVRRSLLLRLAQGATTLGDLRGVDGVEDDSKAFFHMHTLIGGGLVLEQGERYVLTEVGSRAAEYLLARPSGEEMEPIFPNLLLAD